MLFPRGWRCRSHTGGVELYVCSNREVVGRIQRFPVGSDDGRSLYSGAGRDEDVVDLGAIHTAFEAVAGAGIFCIRVELAERIHNGNRGAFAVHAFEIRNHRVIFSRVKISGQDERGFGFAIMNTLSDEPHRFFPCAL